MEIQFDEKGKYYTEVTQKDVLRALIQTSTHRIRGNVYVKPGERLKDGLNEPEQFLAVTDASVLDDDGNVLFLLPFVSVNRDQIVWVTFDPEVEDESAGSGGDE